MYITFNTLKNLGRPPSRPFKKHVKSAPSTYPDLKHTFLPFALPSLALNVYGGRTKPRYLIKAIFFVPLTSLDKKM